jgi:hypothetical protein
VHRIWVPEVYVRYAISLRVTWIEERVEAEKSPKKGKGEGGNEYRCYISVCETVALHDDNGLGETMRNG